MKYNPKKNYCTLFPRKLFGVDYNKACWWHDEQYGFRVKKRGTRKEIDQEFRYDVLEYFAVAGKYNVGFIISTLMYYATRLFGWIRWTK